MTPSEHRTPGHTAPRTSARRRPCVGTGRLRASIAVLALIAVWPLRQSALAQPTIDAWVAEDSTMITHAIETIRNRPDSILTIDARAGGRDDSLGFGYTYRVTTTPGAYATIRLKVVLHDGHPISFSATPLLPFGFHSLYKRYREFYRPLFEIGSDSLPRPYLWRTFKVDAPIEDDAFERGVPLLRHNEEHRDLIDLLMTPYAGIEYGCPQLVGEEGFDNRRIYNQLRPSMSYRVAVYLLRSVNPATRLTAIEYLKQHPEYLKRARLRHDIETVVQACPLVRTRVRGRRVLDNARTLVDRFSDSICDPAEAAIARTSGTTPDSTGGSSMARKDDHRSRGGLWPVDDADLQPIDTDDREK